MTATTTTALVPIQPACSDAERLALADPSEIISRPAMDVLGDVEVTVHVKPLVNGGVREG